MAGTDEHAHSADSTAHTAVTTGVFTGTAAYLVGFSLLIAVERAGLFTTGLWRRTVAVREFPVVHASLHAPVWGGTLHLEALPVTLALLTVLLAAGYLSGKRVDMRGDPFRAGALPTLGFAPLTLLLCTGAVVSSGTVTVTEALAPALLGGVFAPLVFGGIGGALANRRDGAGTESGENRPNIQ